MDRVIEKTKTQRLMKYWPYMAGACLVLIVLGWLVFGNHASTLRVNKDELTISDVCQAEFKDYVRTNGQVLPIQVVQISPEEGGIVMEKVFEEGLSTVIDLRTTSAQLLNSKATLLQCQLMAMVKEQLVRYYRGEAIWTE